MLRSGWCPMFVHSTSFCGSGVCCKFWGSATTLALTSGKKPEEHRRNGRLHTWPKTLWLLLKRISTSNWPWTSIYTIPSVRFKLINDTINLSHAQTSKLGECLHFSFFSSPYVKHTNKVPSFFSLLISFKLAHFYPSPLWILRPPSSLTWAASITSWKVS